MVFTFSKDCQGQGSWLGSVVMFFELVIGDKGGDGTQAHKIKVNTRARTRTGVLGEESCL